MARGWKAALVDTDLVEGPWVLPDGWRWARLGNHADLVRGVSYSKGQTTEVARSGHVPLLRGNNIQDRSLRLSDLVYVQSACVSDVQYLRAGDIVLTMSSGSAALVGKSAFVEEVSEPITFGAFCGCIRAVGGIDPKWTHWFLQTGFYRAQISAAAKGTNINNLKREHLLSLPVPVPPLDTQRHIVARIDELFSELDNGETALTRVRADLETYRKSLLKAAVTGELTADWRAANPPAETGEQLLQRILAERKAHWEADPKNKGNRYKEPEAANTSELTELPEGWTWASFGQIFYRVESGLNVKALANPPAAGQTGIVKLSAVTWWDFDEDASKTLISDTAYDPAALIESGDFLISRANTLELVGAPALVVGLTRRLVLSDKVLRLVMPERLKKWCFFVLRSPFGRVHIESLATGNQLSMRNISQDSLRRLPIPIPPSEELGQALDLLNASLEAGTEAGQQAANGDMAAKQLRQSILAAAFRGELVQ